MSRSRVEWLLATGAMVAVALLVAASSSGAAPTASAVTKVRDQAGETKGLKRKPELDIRRVVARSEPGGWAKFRITMQGRLKPGKKFTRPFILINTRGGKRSNYEYLVLGPRVFERTGKRKYRKVGANRFEAKRHSWVYRFKPARVGADQSESFGMAVLTTKGKTSDLAPNRRYRTFRRGDS